MISRAALLWIAGLLTLVPYGTYYLFFEAPREQYALLITLILFWIFGYWGLAGPLLSALKVRRVYKTIVGAHKQGRLKEALRSDQTAEVAIELIASENRIPRVLAAWVYRLLVRHLSATTGETAAAVDAIPRRIAGFHQDAEQHWVAELECGHDQHVRHDPPWTLRPWVTTAQGREQALGQALRCRKCADGAPPDHKAQHP